MDILRTGQETCQGSFPVIQRLPEAQVLPPIANDSVLCQNDNLQYLTRNLVGIRLANPVYESELAI